MLVSCGHLNKPDAVSVGTIIPFSIVDWNDAKVPLGYLPCLGQKVLKRDYSELYSLVGDELFNLPYCGDDYFYIPDLRDRYASPCNGVDRYLGQLLESENPAHTHTGRCTEEGSSHYHFAPSFNVGSTYNGGGGTGYRSFGVTVRVSADGSRHRHDNVAGGSLSNIGEEEFRPNTMYMLFLIKY